MGTGDPKRVVHRSCTPGVWATETELGEAHTYTTGGQIRGGQIRRGQIRRGQIWGAKSRQRKGTWSRSHALGAKSRRPNRESQIWGAKSGGSTGNQIRTTAVTHLNNVEDLQTQALFEEKCEKSKNVKIKKNEKKKKKKEEKMHKK